MKKLKLFLHTLLFLIIILIDIISLPIQKLFGWEIFQLTEKYLKYLNYENKRKFNKHYEN